MEKERKGIFETNSSSVHAFVIAKKGSYEKHSIVFSGKKFLGIPKEYSSTNEKASYVFSYVISSNAYEKDFMSKVKKELNRLVLWLREDSIGYKFIIFNEEFFSVHDLMKRIKEALREDEYSVYDIASIDHCEEAADFYREVTKSKEDFFQWLFNRQSFFVTGNDGESKDDPMSKFSEFSSEEKKVMIKGN